MERYGGGPIIIHDYDPAWPVLYEQERERMLDALGPVVLTIEHVGSTAVAGQASKPIIDLLVGVRSLAEARTACVEPFEALGYFYIPQYNTWLPEELFFRKGSPGPWTHHAHVMEPSNPRWGELLLVRDYLREHHDVADAYGTLKRALALVFEDDIAGFRDAKSPFVRAVLARARSARGGAATHS